MRTHQKFLIALFFLLPCFASAQSWQWSKKINQPITYNYGNSKGLLTDKKGNVFSYGSKSSISGHETSTDTLGSYLQCYSNNGALLFSKQWKITFYIQKMEYDGNNHFYFAAKFYGTQTIEGITIVSQGNADGVCGKMDLSGHILWMKTFGGGGEDAANGICYDPTDSSIYVTGGIKDTLFFNNSFQSINPQSAIICQYSSNGNLMNYKLYNFPSQLHSNTNCGVEICRNESGNIFVLMDRNADRYWSNDPGTGPIVGRYLFKLNSHLDTLWSTRINGPQSYWGWVCNNMRVAANGDVYLTNEENGKYGGDAQLLRLNGNTGNISWSLPNQDGIYTDVLIDSNIVYLIGREPGYFVIKKYDENNTVMGETRISSISLYNITKDISGNIFVTGMAFGKSVIVGADTIMGDSVFNGYNYNYYGKFLSKLNDINCVPPIISVSVSQNESGHFYPLCPGDTASLTVNLTAGGFIWSNGKTGMQTTVGSTGNYSVSNNQPNGCIAYSLPVSVKVNGNINSHKICMVTYNEAVHKNTIVVKKDDYHYTYDIKQINLYKRNGNSIIPLNSTTNGNLEWGTVFSDSSSNPDSGFVEYYISTIDTCNTESNLSLVHKSIFLDVNPDLNNRNVLNWNAYIGIPVTGYRIWRGISANALVLYDSVNVSDTTYTDQSTSSTHYFYQVQTMNQGSCHVNNTSYRSSRSNIANDNNYVLTIASASSTNSIDIFPNPSRGIFQINYSFGSSQDRSSTGKNKLQVNVINSKGEKVYEESISQLNGGYKKIVDLSKQANGVYFIEVIENKKRTVKKIVLN